MDNRYYVWAWKDAPRELKNLSRNGGDEDYVFWAPPESVEYFYTTTDSYGTQEWHVDLKDYSLQRMAESGVCGTDWFVLEDGSAVAIGYHA